MTFSFGGLQQERIEIDVLRYERQQAEDIYDKNWLTVQISIHVGGFRGNINAAILTGELVAFLGQLRPLFETLRGSAKFTTMEDQLGMRLVADGKGHINLEGEVADRAGVGNRLSFGLHFDQTQLGASIRELEKVVAEFPKRIP